MSYSLNCHQCGTVFLDSHKSKKYCCMACFRTFEAMNGRPAATNKAERHCAHCGKLFLVQAQREAKRRFCGNSCRAAWQSSLPYDAWRGKLSANKSNRARGKANGMWGKPAPHGKAMAYRRTDGRVIRLRSGWELATATYFDRIGVSWEYEPRRFVLADRTYTPDFWLPDQGCFWEVKGWMHSRHAETVRQFRSLHPKTPLIVIGKGAIKGIAAATGITVRL